MVITQATDITQPTDLMHTLFLLTVKDPARLSVKFKSTLSGSSTTTIPTRTANLIRLRQINSGTMLLIMITPVSSLLKLINFRTKSRATITTVMAKSLSESLSEVLREMVSPSLQSRRPTPLSRSYKSSLTGS
jgi:hypothetical protein